MLIRGLGGYEEYEFSPFNINLVIFSLILHVGCLVLDKEKYDVVDKHEKTASNSHERVIIGGEREVIPEKPPNHVSNELLQKFEGKTREVRTLSRQKNLQN